MKNATVREGDTISDSLTTENQQLTKSACLRCATGTCRNSTAFFAVRQAVRFRLDVKLETWQTLLGQRVRNKYFSDRV